MKTVPSLIASSTVGAAAVGLAFGQPHPSERPAPTKRSASDYDAYHTAYTPSYSQPPPSSIVNTPIQEDPSAPSSIQPHIRDYFSSASAHAHAQYNENEGEKRVPSWRNGDIADHMPEDRKGSISSRNSWMRRLSLIVPSHHSSPRSSIGPDSPSITFSYGSGAPILSANTGPVHTQPNKLVKRAPSSKGASRHSSSRPGSIHRVPTLRRPATSHQRSVTLQQQYQDEEPRSVPRTSFHDDAPAPVIMGSDLPAPGSLWHPYFESRTTRLAKDRPSTDAVELSNDGFYSTSKRIHMPDRTSPPTLMKPEMVRTATSARPKTRKRGATISVDHAISHPGFEHHPEEPPQMETEHKRKPRPSMSINFAAPTWMNRAGSLRVRKRRESGHSIDKLANAVLPDPPAPPARASTSHGNLENINGHKTQADSTLANFHFEGFDMSGRPLQHTRPFTPLGHDRMSPLPQISRLSSFHIDYAAMSTRTPSDCSQLMQSSTRVSSTNSQPVPRDVTDSRARPLSSHPVVLHQTLPRRVSELVSDRGSTLIGADDIKNFINVEDEEIDFQSDTAYDSYRTGATGSLRARSTPLDSMFDESPPSSGSRSKIADFHEMALMSAFRNPDELNKPAEETTPMKKRNRGEDDFIIAPIREITEPSNTDAITSSPPAFRTQAQTPRRVSNGTSIEVDDDEDWTKDDDSFGMSTSLYPPGSPFSGQRTGRLPSNDGASSRTFGDNLSIEERPKNVFDWSETQAYDRQANTGSIPRPGTVHGGQGGDSRLGRASSRNRPAALHIRSQSVPAVPEVDGQREPKVTSKFGTWGLGAKGVSEDWDNDFDFDCSEIDEGSGLPALVKTPMHVPPAIQASQANVVGHVGQIREVCLLVDDLKRLRGLAREKGLIHGPSADKWREAEGIIALAIPDEEDPTLSPPQSPSAYSRKTASRSGHRKSMTLDSLEESHDGPAKLPKALEPRRQSILNMEDDIFGAALPKASSLEPRPALGPIQGKRHHSHMDSTEVARSVMENIHQHRTASDPTVNRCSTPGNKMPFDTTSLRDLVQRANALTRALSEIIRKADGLTSSPSRDHREKRDSSPAFTRVFTEPKTTPANKIPRSQSSNSMLNGSIHSSPARTLSEQLQMMTVS